MIGGFTSLQHNPDTPGVPLTRSISYNTGRWVHILGIVYADHTVHTWAWVPSARSTKDVNHTTFYRPLASGHPPSCTTMLGNFSSACQRRQASTRCPVPSFILVLFCLWAVIMAACPLHKVACKSSTHCATFCRHRSRRGFRSIDECPASACVSVDWACCRRGVNVLQGIGHRVRDVHFVLLRDVRTCYVITCQYPVRVVQEV